MTNVKLLLPLGLLALATAGCAATERTTYYPQRTAYVQPGTTYYAPAPSTTYYAPSQAQAQSRYWNSPRADADRDGIPNRYDRDANGDGVPDRYQGRR